MLVNVAVCKVCGRENQDLYKFCLGCGAELNAAPSSHGGDKPLPRVALVEPAGNGGGALADDDVPDEEHTPVHERTPAPFPVARAVGDQHRDDHASDDDDDEDELRTRRDSLAHLAPVPRDPPAGFDSARLCPSCGHDVPPEFTFCGSCGARVDAPPARASAPAAPSLLSAAEGRLVLIRPDGTEGGAHPLHEGENVIGRGLGPLFDADGYLSPRHAELVLNAAGLVVRDTASLNGVFVKLHEEEELFDGDIFRIGQELLRFDEIPAPMPLEDGTDIMGSPNPGYWGRLALIVGRDQDGSAFPLFGDAVTLGRERGDILFPEDGYVSGQHARVAMRDGKYYLCDLNSSNGTFLRVRGERQVKPGSAILIGQQLFRVSY